MRGYDACLALHFTAWITGFSFNFMINRLSDLLCITSLPNECTPVFPLTVFVVENCRGMGVFAALCGDFRLVFSRSATRRLAFCNCLHSLICLFKSSLILWTTALLLNWSSMLYFFKDFPSLTSSRQFLFMSMSASKASCPSWIYAGLCRCLCSASQNSCAIAGMSVCKS